MITVGLTGGIGSGKSIIGRLFTCLNIPLFNSDDTGRTVLETAPYKNQIIKLIGNKIVDSSGALDRRKIAALVFADPDLLKQLNGIIHPAVNNSFKNWVSRHEYYKYGIKETAILFESGIYKQVDYIITITAPKALKIKRITERSKLTLTEIESRMNNQWTDEEKIKRSDFQIINDETRLVIPQVLEIHNKLFNSK